MNRLPDPFGFPQTRHRFVGRIPGRQVSVARPVGSAELVERRACEHAGLLQLDDHQRQAVDEADQVRPAGVERAGDAELADQQEIIVRRMLLIHRAKRYLLQR
jgi:hypothetical protein